MALASAELTNSVPGRRDAAPLQSMTEWGQLPPSEGTLWSPWYQSSVALIPPQ